MKRKLGWKPDLPDFRDHSFAKLLPRAVRPAVLPTSIDLTSQCPPIRDQGEQGCCTGFGSAAVFQFMEPSKNAWTPSPAFIYWNERVIEGTTDQDAGAQIRDGIKSLVKYGVCNEKLFPYDDKVFAAEPPQAAFDDAKKHTVVGYYRVNQTLTDIKTALAAKYPIVFGISVYGSFMSDKVATTGVVPMPGRKESVEGGHCIVAVGYKDSTKQIICRNSWGTGWGLKGYFLLPYAYITNSNLASDFWVVTKETA